MADNSRIEIHQPNMNIVMADKPYPAPENSQKVLEAQGGVRASKSIRLLMRTEATMRLFESISWGEKYKRQDVEKAGLLVGRYYKDTSRREPVVWGDVVAVIPFDPSSVEASKTNITITQDAWRKMLNEFVSHKDGGYLMLGWYHTHLDDIPPRFSGLDTATQRQYFNGKYSFAVVLNPNQRNWTVYCGPMAKECKGDLFVAEEMLEQFREPKITIQDVRGDSRLNQDGTITHFNPDGTLVAPDIPTTLSIPEQSFLDRIGEKLFGKRRQRPNHQVTSQQHTDFSTDDPGNDPNQEQSTTRSQYSPVVHRPQNVQQPMPRIIVKETVTPKITILPKDNQNESRRVVQATVFVVNANDTSHRQRQSQEGLQIIEQNIIEVVDSIILSNANTSISLSNPVNAQITLNNDLTLEVCPCEAKSNALLRISTQPFDIAFPKKKTDLQVLGVAEIIRRQRGEASYLFYISKTPESIRVNAFQIKKEIII